MRSRTMSLPCSRWRLTADSLPPARAVASRSRRSATSPSMCARFSWNSDEDGSTCEERTATAASMPRPRDRDYRIALRRSGTRYNPAWEVS